jgi:hypothetical protein
VSETTSRIRKQKNSRQRGIETKTWTSTRCLDRRNPTVGWADERSPTRSLECRNGGARRSADPTLWLKSGNYFEHVPKRRKSGFPWHGNVGFIHSGTGYAKPSCRVVNALKCCLAATFSSVQRFVVWRICNTEFELESAVSATTPLQWRFACFRNQPSLPSLGQSCSVRCRPRARTGHFVDHGSATRLRFRIKVRSPAWRSRCRHCRHRRCRIRGVPTGRRFHNADRVSPFAASPDGTFTGSTAAAVTTRQSIASSRSRRLHKFSCACHFYVSWPRSSGFFLAENVDPRWIAAPPNLSRMASVAESISESRSE